MLATRSINMIGRGKVMLSSKSIFAQMNCQREKLSPLRTDLVKARNAKQVFMTGLWG